MNKIKFRKDIQFLRAIAVLIVFLFHLKIDYFGYGYLGVDIFFFISGYLITQILYFNYLNFNHFKLRDFFINRILRIVPLYLAVIFFTLIGFSFIFSPYHLTELVNSAIYSNFFLSNFYFLVKHNYFDLEAIFKPLLHTWSLSVEMHFYFVFPLILYLIISRFKNNVLLLFNIILLVSLIGLSYFQYKDNLTFYFSLFRGFEFLIGIIAAISIQKKKFDITSLLIILIFIVVSFYTQDFDLLFKLLCLICVYLVVFFELIPRVLYSNAIFLYFGKISYSIYLLHWPIIVFINYFIFRDLILYEKLYIFIITIILSSLSYKYIESFFKKKNYITIKLIFIIFISILIILFSLKIIDQDLTEKKLDFNQINILKSIEEKTVIIDQCKIHFNVKLIGINSPKFPIDCLSEEKKNILIYGDSHALDLFNSLSLTHDDVNILSFSQDDCRLSGSIKYNKKKNCNFEFINKYIAKINNLDIIIYTQKGSYLFHNKTNEPLNIDSVDLLISSLKTTANLSNSEFIFFGVQREFKTDLNNLIHMESKSLGNRTLYSENIAITELDKILNRKFNLIKNIKYVSKIDTIQKDGDFKLLFNNKFLYNNKTHWSTSGEKYFGRKIRILNLFNIYEN
tara:strand:+ start:2570 stop:4441 length:1872 start_codon:yes stop_codon:yes gene_type:complete